MVFDKEYTNQCKQVWLEAWVRTAQSSTCLKATIATDYADKCLEDFKTRFVKSEE